MSDLTKMKAACFAALDLRDAGLTQDEAFSLLKRWWNVGRIKPGNRPSKHSIKLTEENFREILGD